MDMHIIKALSWRLWRAAKRRYILIPFCIIFPCYLIETVSLVDVTDIEIASNWTNQTTLHYSVLFSTEMIKNRSTIELLYYPNNENTTRLIDHFKEVVQDGNTFPDVIAVEKEQDIEKHFIENYGNISTDGPIGFGIIIKELTRNKLTYSLRNTMTNIWHTKELFAPKEILPSNYLDYGFISVMAGLNMAYMRFINKTHDDWYFQQFPSAGLEMAENENKSQTEKVYDNLALLIVVGLLPLVLVFVGRIVTEKKIGAREILRLSGVGDLGIYGYWFVYFMLHCFVITIVYVYLFMHNFGRYALFAHANPLLLWIYLFVACLHMAIMVFALSAVFVNPTYGTIFSLVVVYGLISVVSKVDKPTASFFGFLYVMTPVGSLYHAFRVIASLEQTKVGFKFDQLLYVEPFKRAGSMELVFLGTFFGMVFMTLFFMYMDQVKPGDYGTAQPWHFIFLSDVWRDTPKAKQKQEVKKKAKEKDKVNKGIVEKADLPVGIKIDDLRKNFGPLHAVNGLSIDIYKNQITVLLGHNGAGKTTLMSILTGVISPTSGDVIVGGTSLFKDMSKFRRKVGYCPQHDILLQDLSVYEQIVFFGMVRGRPRAQVSRDAVGLMTKFNIAHRRNALPTQLSGGMKRKLCLAVSMANNPKILFLDEPSSGLDPQSRRKIWDTLLELRGNRTIIITTHFMEEADVLGDKIAIMAHGELRCYGTSIFLKKHFGTGHRITVTYSPQGNPETIRSTVEEEIPTVTTKEKPQQNLITFNIPLEDTSKLKNVFSRLESAQKRDQINEIGVTCTSMEEVFLKVQEGEGISTDFDKGNFRHLGAGDLKKCKGIVLFVQRFCALLFKRIISLRSTIFFLLCCLLLIPLFFTYMAFVMSGFILTFNDPHSMVVSLDMYGGTKVVVGGSNQSVIEPYINSLLKMRSIPIFSEEDSGEVLLYSAEEDQLDFQYKMIIAADFNAEPVVLHSLLAYHAAPISVNMLFNAFLNDFTVPKSQMKPQRLITVINHPYSLKAKDSCDASELMSSMAIPFLWVFFAFGIMFAFAFFVRFPITEKQNGMKQLQYMTGLSPITYWLSNLLFDLVLFCGVIVGVLFIMLIKDDYNIFAESDVKGNIVFVTFLYACAMLTECYFFSFIFKTLSGAINVLIMTSIIFLPAGYVSDMLLRMILRQGFTGKRLHYLFFLSPTTPYVHSIYSIVEVACQRQMCNKCTSGDAILEYCKDVDKKKFGIQENVIFLCIDFGLFLILTIMLDYRCIQYGIHKIKEKMYKPIEAPKKGGDSDVQEEKRRVMQSKKDEKHVLVTDNLGKKYAKNQTAVYDVSFVAGKGECFGLLGVNGAGKSTTFNMLTGDLFPSQGDARMNINQKLYSLSKSRSKFLQNVGYCPQENHITEEMTARQLLNLFAILRGATRGDSKKLSQQWIKNLDLHLYCDKACGRYSGGNKRKLCTAIALIADPTVVLLDEPTTGVDPVSKRKLWKVLKQIQVNNQTIILTSHSMDECEATCNRLTIMVGGKMRCIGTIQYLKHKFALGFTILIKIDLDAPEEEVEKIKDRMSKTFGKMCILKDEYKGFLHYHLGNKDYKWSVLFGKMAVIKKKFKKIEEYMLSDTSLEQVFLTLADEKKKDPDEKKP